MYVFYLFTHTRTFSGSPVDMIPLGLEQAQSRIRHLRAKKRTDNYCPTHDCPRRCYCQPKRGRWSLPSYDAISINAGSPSSWTTHHCCWEYRPNIVATVIASLTLRPSPFTPGTVLMYLGAEGQAFSNSEAMKVKNVRYDKVCSSQCSSQRHDIRYDWFIHQTFPKLFFGDFAADRSSRLLKITARVTDSIRNPFQGVRKFCAY